MNLKNQKGSITLFVLIALLFYMGFLLLMYANNLNKIQALSEKTKVIKSIYAKNVENIDEVYNRESAKNDKKYPILKELPKEVITNITEEQLNASYEEYGATGGWAEYIVFNNKFDSFKKVIEYARQNELYGDTSIRINAYGNNELLTTENKTVKIVKGIKVTNEEELRKAFESTVETYILILNDINCNNTINANNINYRLDLNNKAVSYTKSNESYEFITLDANSKLIILDSSDKKFGKITANLIDTTSNSDGVDRKHSVFCIRNYGELTIDSGSVSTIINQSLVKKSSGSGIDSTGTSIDNFGTVNLNGGSIVTKVETNAVVWAVVVDAVSTAKGIINAGIVNLNDGMIQCWAEASMQKAGMVYGRTFAYSYGIVNVGGTINNSNRVTFSTEAIVHTEGTYKDGTDKGAIVTETKSLAE